MAGAALLPEIIVQLMQEMIVRRNLIASIAALLVTASADSATAPAPCADPAYHQFDFWLGQWEVRTPDGKLAGANHIEREYDGCVVHERYTTDHAFRGESLNTYDAGRKLWHQTWMDNSGTLLVLEGVLAGSTMVLEGDTTGGDGAVTHHRIRWTPGADGSVRQLWESRDSKGQWTTTFDGNYVRR